MPRYKFPDRLRGLTAAIIRDVEREMYAAADIIATEAAISITRGSVSGKKHVASRPGDAPNADTQTLNRGINVVQTGRLECEIQSTAPYSADLEFGTSKMEPRPFMGPAARISKLEVSKRLSAAARRAIRRHMAGE